MSDSYVVYVHENKINHKRYVGITCQKPEYRWGENGKRYQECPLFWNAIQKYGWDNFDHTILYTGLTAEEANNLEIETIRLFDSANQLYGYNLSAGGFGINSDTMKLKWEDKEFHDEMCQRMKEAWKDPAKRKRRAEKASARWSDEDFKKKVSESIKKSCGSSVVCVETGVVYDNICDVENSMGLNHAHICRAIHTGYRCGGYHWKYNESISEKPND